MSACVIATTDYRKLFPGADFSENYFSILKKNLRSVILQYYRNMIKDFYLNCEYGITLWSAEIICELKKSSDIKLHITVPYEDQVLNWKEEYRNRYYRVHETADSVKYISKQYTETCYAEADELMVKKSNCILIFGHPSEKFYIAQYAKRKRFVVVYFDIRKMLDNIQ